MTSKNLSLSGPMRLMATLFAICVASMATATVSAMGSAYMYGANFEPTIFEHDPKASKGMFMDSNKPRIVEFYSPSCGACQTFKPTFVNLAKEITSAYNDVEVYAVSCEHHTDVCRDYKVPSYPSLLGFQAGHSEPVRFQRSRNPLSNGYSVSEIAERLELTANAEKASAARRLDEDNSNENGEKKSAKPGKDKSDEEDEDEDRDEKKGAKPGKDKSEEEDEDKDKDADADADADKDDEGDSEEAKSEEAEEEEDSEEKEAVKKHEEHKPHEHKHHEHKPHEHKHHEHKHHEHKGVAAAAAAHGSSHHNHAAATWAESKKERDIRKKNGFERARQKKLEMQQARRDGKARNDKTTKQKDVDRFEDLLKKRREMVKRRNEAGDLSRLHNGEAHFDLRVGKAAQARERRVTAKPEEQTKGMKVFDPTTEEYRKRREELAKRFVASAQKKEGGIFKKKPDAGELRERFRLAQQQRKSTFQKDVKKGGIVSRAVDHVPVANRIVRLTGEEALILDSTLSFYQGLQMYVFKTNAPLSSDQQNVLKRWLEFLSVSLPPEWALHRLIDTLLRDISKISQSPAALQAVLRTYELKRTAYSHSCRTNGQESRFACGFWKLLHTATIGVAEQRGGLNLLDAELVGPGTETFSPVEASNVIRDYMDTFYPCKDCSEHFVKTFDDCDMNRRCDRLSEEYEDASVADWKELALWLWEFHNDVSVRVLNEKMSHSKQGSATEEVEMKKAIEVLWPSLNQCMACLDEDGTWNEAEVFVYLEHTYWAEAHIDPIKDRLLAFDDDSTNNILGTLVMIIFVILLVVYRLVGSRSAAIQKSVVVARSLVANATRSATGRAKERSA